MNILIKAVGTTALAVTLAALAAPAFASTGPAFSAAKPWSGMDVNSFRPDVRTFNSADISDLLRAKTVSVVKLDSAWSDGGDAGKAFNAVNHSDQAIHLLRTALKDNPMAAKLLARNHINVNTVVDITEVGNGQVQLYIS
jgi:hypothetical protein